MNNNPIFSEHPWLIVTFAVAVLIMLIIDLGIFNKKGSGHGRSLFKLYIFYENIISEY
jgi:hypothetical protein